MTTITTVRLDQLVVDPDNPREDPGDVSDLTTSIENIGLIQALQVRQLEDKSYAVVAGSRRHAAMLASKKLKSDFQVPVTIVTSNGSHSTVAGLVENLQREDLTQWEEADAFARLVNEFGMTQKQIAEMTGFHASLISRRIAISVVSPAGREALTRVSDVRTIEQPEMVKVAKLTTDVPDEVWATVKTPNDLHRLVRAQEFQADKARFAKQFKGKLKDELVEEPVIANHEQMPPAPEGYEVEFVQARSANEAKDVEILPSDHGVVQRYASWVPIRYRKIDTEAVEKEKQAVKDQRAETRERNARSKEAQAQWYEQWWSVILNWSANKCRQFLVDDIISQLEATDYSRRHPLSEENGTALRLAAARGWDKDDTPAQFTEALEGKDQLRVLCFGVICRLTPEHAVTGDPAKDRKQAFDIDTPRTRQLKALVAEYKVKFPKVQ